MSRILIADDEWLTRLEIEEMLTDLGYEVVGQAETGAESIALARERNPDLVIMDVAMPGELNGIEAAGRIKNESGTPIIFVSGHGDPEYVEAAKEIAPFGYVMKPFDEQEIRASVEIALTKRALELKLKEAHERLEVFNCGLVKEIEARKRTEKSLRESEKLYRDIFLKNSAMKWLVDPSTARIIDANPAACSFYGYSHEEITTLRLWDINMLSEAQVRKDLASALADEQTEFKFKHLTASGEIRYVQVFTGKLESGGKTLFHSIIIDITERHYLEEKRKEAISQLQATLDATADGIVVLSLDSRISVFNRRYQKLWNMPDELLQPGDAEPVLQFMFRQIIEPEVFSQSVRSVFGSSRSNKLEKIFLKDGRVFEAYSRPQNMNGKMVGRVWSFRDMTDKLKV